MKKLLSVFIVISLVLIASCSSQVTQEQETPVIVTSFYPVEEITSAIVADNFEVKLLVPPGADPHSYEPTPTQLVELSKADVFVVMGGLFEHIEEEVIEINPELIIIEATHDIERISGDDEHAHEEESHEEETHEEESHEHEGEYDPHVWLSIHNMESMTQEIEEELTSLYPEYEQEFRANAQLYTSQLEELEEEFETRLSTCQKEEIIVNHKAFGYFAHEYGFEQISVAGFSPESEPSPRTIQQVIDEAKEHDLKYVFSEGQMDPKVAQTIANDIEGEVLELHPIKMNSNQTYFTLMRGNLDNLVIGLECQE